MDGTVATSSPAATPTPSSPASSSTHSYSAADSACTDTALIVLRVVGIGNDVLAAPNPLPLGALGVGPWLQASSEAHGTLRWYRLQHANTGRVYHVLGVPDYRTTSPFTAVSYYAVADAAITFMPTRVSYMESSAEGARAAAGTSSNKRRGAMPFAVVGHADQTGPLLSELLRRSARSLQVAHVVVEHVDQAATERLAGAVEAALTTVVDALHTATGPHGAPDAQTAATAGRREGPFRAVILTRFPKAKVYLVSVQQGEVAVGDVVVCSSNANASCTRVNSMQCVTTRRAVQRAAAGSMVTLSVELFYSANPHALHSIFDVLCAADNTMSLPACLLAVRVLSTTPLIRAHLNERVLVQGTGGTSYGWVIGHGRGEEPSETILIVTSPYATVSLAAAGDVVGLCGKLPKHQRDEGADMLGSAIVLSCVHILSIHREILHAADMTKHGATAEAVTDLVQRFLSFFTASSYVPGFNLTKDAAFWLRFAVTRHTATEVSLELLKRLSSPPDADGSTQRWYGLTRDNAAHPCGLTLPVLITAMTRTKDAAKRVALLDELFKGCLLSAPLHIEENIRNSDREPTVLYDFAADDEHLVTIFAPEARYSYNVCPLPNELVSLHRLQEADIYPPPRRGFAANGWTVVQLERISACVENSSDACAKFLDALVSTGWLAPEDWHRVLTPPNIPRHPGACAALLMHPASHAVNLATAVVALFSSDVHPPWVSFYVALNRPAAERSGVDFGLQFLRRTRQAQHGSEGKLPLEVHWKHDFVCKSKSIYTAAWFRLLQRVLRGLLPLDLILSCVLPCLVPIQAFDA